MAISDSAGLISGPTRVTRRRFIVLGGLFSLAMLTIVDRVAVSAAKVDISRDLGFNDITFGTIFGSFALGYALFQIPTGFLADRIGSRLSMVILVGAWSSLTIFPTIVHAPAMFVGLWFLFGAAEAGAFPISARVVRSWLPAKETGVAQGILFSGSRLGAAFGLSLVSWAIAHSDWRKVFVDLGAVGIIWALCWLVAFRDTPPECAWVPEPERTYIRTDRSAPEATRTPGKSLWEITELPALFGQYFASNFTFFLCFTWLLPYLRQRYGLTPEQASWFAAIPLYLGAASNWVSGGLVDWLYRRKWQRLSRVIPGAAGFLLATVAILYAANAATPLIASLSIGVATFGVDFTLSPSWTLCIDVGDGRTGTLSGAMNMCGNFGSFLSSLAFPILFHLTGRWSTFFYCAAAINLCGAVLWATLAREPHEGRPPDGDLVFTKGSQ